VSEEDATALGERLSACRHFRPMPGLKDMQGRTWDDSLLWRWNPVLDVPDLRQPATMGILLALVREAWQNPHIWVESSTGEAFIGWAAPEYQPAPPDIVRATEAEALVAALEAAP